MRMIYLPLDNEAGFNFAIICRCVLDRKSRVKKIVFAKKLI